MVKSLFTMIERMFYLNLFSMTQVFEPLYRHIRIFLILTDVCTFICESKYVFLQKQCFEHIHAAGCQCGEDKRIKFLAFVKSILVDTTCSAQHIHVIDTIAKNLLHEVKDPSADCHTKNWMLFLLISHTVIVVVVRFKTYYKTTYFSFSKVLNVWGK